MLRQIIEWLQGILEVGGPSIFDCSSLLPGNHSGREFLPPLSPVEEIWEKIGIVKWLIEQERWEEARRELERVDSLFQTLNPHTPQFEKISAFKTHLWELILGRE